MGALFLLKILIATSIMIAYFELMLLKF